MVHRNRLIALSFKYQGNQSLIKRALDQNELITPVDCHQCIVFGDSNYPKMFYELSKPPYVLFYEGDITLLNAVCIGIIGSRKACRYALDETQHLIRHLPVDFVVVSGLARGIDGYAHACALKGCRTIAVVGHGLDIVYPKENEALFQSIRAKGLLLSEYPIGTPIRKHQFIERNRIIAALSSRLCVMQASLKSGTMGTVEFALALGIEIFALPYHVHEIEGEGCNLLIQQGAGLLTSEPDLFKL